MTDRTMDFSPDEESRVIDELASSVFAGHSPDHRVAQTERDRIPYDVDLWRHLISTGILESIFAERTGGGGLGMVGLSLVAQQQGRHLSRVPLVPTAVAGMALSELGEGHRDVLEKIRSGESRVAIATPELCNGVAARSSASGWRLSGHLDQVYLAGSCTDIVVTAGDEDGNELAFLLGSEHPGVSVEAFDGISRNIHASVGFDDVRVDQTDLLVRPDDGPDPARWMQERLLTGLAALGVGVCAEALRRTADYVSEREQFGRPLSTNQGVAMRAADAYIDVEAMNVTVSEAAWLLDHGEEAGEAVAIATWWAREAGVRVVHATQHLHGGSGADTDNHIHRYFLWARELDMIAGPAPIHLGNMGDLLVTEGTS